MEVQYRKPEELKEGDNWYRPGPSLVAFHESDARVRVLVGGRGCGKTTTISVEAIRHCLYNAGAKVYILRKTQEGNSDTTLDTFEYVLGRMGTAFVETATSLFKKIDGGVHFRIPSQYAIEKYEEFQRSGSRERTQAELKLWLKTVGDSLCGHVHFAGVPSSQYRATRFRGYECSMLIFVEADQLDSEDLDLGLACLRAKGTDPRVCNENGFIRDTCVILDTNPPGTNHWIAKKEEQVFKDLGLEPHSLRSIRSKDGREEYWHIATEEGRHNLPPDYIEGLISQYRKNPAMLKRMIYGEYADAFDGKPVFMNFEQDAHSFDVLDWPKGAYLIRGWDFGTTQAVVFSAYFSMGNDEYWWDMAEYCAIQSDTDTQCQRVREITNRVFPFWNDREICAGVKDFCDPAGAQKKAEGSSLRVLHTHGFFPGYRMAGLAESLAMYNRLLEKKDQHGNFIYRIDKRNCPLLYVASCGGYRYPNVGEVGFGSDAPFKGVDVDGKAYDHVADASRYAKIGCLRLLKTAHEETNPLTGRMVQPVKVNRPRVNW